MKKKLILILMLVCLPTFALAEDLSFEGKVTAQINKPVINPYPMQVDKLLVSIGENVKEGDRLVEYHLDTRDRRVLQHELLGEGGLRDSQLTIASMENERANLANTRKLSAELVAGGFAPGEELAAHNRSLNMLQKRIKEAKQKNDAATLSFSSRLEELQRYLGYPVKGGERLPKELYLLAPASGTIIDIAPNVRTGATVGGGAVAMNIAKLNPVQIQIQVYENEINKLSVGQEVKIELAKDKNVKLTGKIALISWAPIDPRIAVPSFYNVYIDVENPDHVLKPGYKVLAHIETD